MKHIRLDTINDLCKDLNTYAIAERGRVFVIIQYIWVNIGNTSIYFPNHRALKNDLTDVT